MTRVTRFLLSLALMASLASAVTGQSPTPTPLADSGDVVRISTNLIQTGVMVTNRKGEIVTGLKKEDFQLFVDGRPVTPEFFEPVRIASGRGNPATSSAGAGPGPTIPFTDARRTMVFFVDDLHMSAESLIRTRRVIQSFVENQLLPSDRAAIVASSGKVGFLQQFTFDKDMLLRACERLVYSQKSSDEAGPPPMTEFDAQTIDRGDSDLTSRFVSLTLRYNPGMTSSQAYTLVRARARGILNNTAAYTATTLDAMESTAVAAANFPGRKAIYFFSDGMILNPERTGTPDLLRKITSAAARANVVIYSFDAKGLEGFPLGNSVDSPDMSGLGLAQQAAEKLERQDALNYFADKTGGRFIKNTNDIKGNLSAVAEEAFQYYLLAWEPTDASPGNFRRIEVKVPGRTDVRVSYQTGYLDRSPSTADRQSEATTPAAIRPGESSPSDGLPTHLALTYLQLAGQGPSLSATIEVDPASVTFAPVGEERVADIELTVTVYNDKGESHAAFKVPLKMNTPKDSVNRPKEVKYDYLTPLKPGFYQVRVNARDPRSGRTGGVARWVEILPSSKTSLSSLMLGSLHASGNNGERALERNVEQRFSQRSSMQFLGFIYPADPRKFDKQKVTILADVMQAGRSVISREGLLTSIAGSDASRVSYSGEVPLDELSPGHYELRVTVTKAGDKPLIRRTYFEVF